MDGSNVTYVTRAPPARAVARQVRAPSPVGEDAMAHQSSPRRHLIAWVFVSILLIIAVAGTLVVPIYARSTPKLGDFPFFYWYQLLWVPLVGILSWIAYLLVRSSDAGSASSAAGGPQAAAPGTRPDDAGGAR